MMLDQTCKVNINDKLNLYGINIELNLYRINMYDYGHICLSFQIGTSWGQHLQIKLKLHNIELTEYQCIFLYDRGDSSPSF